MQRHSTTHEPSQNHRRLLVMILLSFMSMYGLMYGMVNSFDNVYMNINQVYMAGLMAAPMGLIELGLMGAMYRNKMLNIAVRAPAATAFPATSTAATAASYSLSQTYLLGGIVLIALLLVFLILHFAGGSFSHH